jgi:hypothetical protein
MEDHTTLFYRFGIALFIGILVGLQREYSYDEENDPGEKSFAGVRTLFSSATLETLSNVA